MSPWTELKEENLVSVPSGVCGVFQLGREPGKIVYVGRADASLRDSLREFLNKGYGFFQWVQVPWTKESYEMQCRLYHYASRFSKIDNQEHPYPPEGMNWKCNLSTKSPFQCDYT